MKKRMLSGLLALVMVLAMLPGEALAAESSTQVVTTIEELDAIANLDSTNVTVKSGANIVSTKEWNTTYEFASLTIEEGAALSVPFLSCKGSLNVYGTLETQYDITCSGSLILAAVGRINLGRTLSLSNMNKKPAPIVSLAGAIDYKMTDNRGEILFFYNEVYTEQEFLDILAIAAGDADSHHKYYIGNDDATYAKKNLDLTQEVVIPENTVLSIYGPDGGSFPGMTITETGKLVNRGIIHVHDSYGGLHDGKIMVNGSLINEGSLSVGGKVNITGKLENSGRISMSNQSGGAGTLTLETGGTYSGGGSISTDYRSGDYTDYICGFDFSLFDIDQDEYNGVWFVTLRLKDPGTETPGPDVPGPDVPDDPDDPDGIKLLDLRPANGGQMAVWSPSSLELRIVFDHGIEGFDFSKGTLSIYEYDTDARVFFLHPLSDGRPTPDVSLSYTDPRIMSVKTISNNLKLKPNTRYYVKLDKGFVQFTGTDKSIALNKGDWVFSTASAEYFSTTADITFKNGYGRDTTTVSAQWDDAWFLNNDSNVYNHDLATTSMALCGAAYSSGADARDALEKFGFTFTKSYNYGRALSEDDCDSVCYTFGIKEIRNADGAESAYLIAVVIRGTGGNEEWYSNFNIGTSSDHLGFAKAERALMDDLEDYLVDARRGFPGAKSGNKFLVTGHSRGAAVANLLAARLSYSDYATAGNVYAYTFATPKVSTKATESGYTNIFNIVTGEDFVPQLPLTKWSFKRYGVDLLLPSQSYYSSNEFFDVSEKAYKKFEILTGKSFKEYDGESPGTIKVCQVISETEKLAPDVYAYYTKKYDPSIKGGILKTTTPYTYFHDTLARMLVTNSAADAAIFANHAAGDFGAITRFFIANGKDIGSIMQSRIFCAHCPAGYYSWMSTCTPEELFGKYNGGARSTFKRLTVKCPVDVFVYNEDGTLVASIVDEKVIENTLAVSVEDGRKVVDLPGDQTYTVKTVATGDGTVSYTVEEMSASGGTSETLRTVKFNAIDIQTGDELRGTVDNVEFTASANYALTKNGTDSIYVDYDGTLPPEEPDVPDIPVTPDIPTAPGGTYIPVTPVTPNPGAPAPETPSVPETPAQPETPAVPEQPEVSLPFTDVSAGDWFHDAVRYVYGEGMMNGTSATLFSPNQTTTRGMIVTILYRLEGEPAAGAAAFADVPAGQWYSGAVAWAAANGIAGGYGDGRFGPGDTVTREQIAAILYRYTAFKGGDTSARADMGAYRDAGEISPYALDALRWAVAQGVVSGYGEGRLGPREPASRAQLAQMLMNYLEK